MGWCQGFAAKPRVDAGRSEAQRSGSGPGGLVTGAGWSCRPLCPFWAVECHETLKKRHVTAQNQIRGHHLFRTHRAEPRKTHAPWPNPMTQRGRGRGGPRPYARFGLWNVTNPAKSDTSQPKTGFVAGAGWGRRPWAGWSLVAGAGRGWPRGRRSWPGWPRAPTHVLQSLMSLFGRFPTSNSAKHEWRSMNGGWVRARDRPGAGVYPWWGVLNPLPARFGLQNVTKRTKSGTPQPKTGFVAGAGWGRWHWAGWSRVADAAGRGCPRKPLSLARLPPTRVLQSLMPLFARFPASNSAKHERGEWKAGTHSAKHE